MTADPLAVLLLAGIATLEGARELPPGSRVLRVSGRKWTLARAMQLVGRHHLTTFSTALAPSIALPVRDASDAALDADAVRARRARVQGPLALLRGLTALLLVALVGGAPYATARWRAWGLLGALALALLLALACATITGFALRRLGATPRHTLARGGAMLWPFAALRAHEAVLATVVHGAHATAVMRAFLSDETLIALGRAAWYDARAGRAPSPESLLSADELAAMVPRDTLDAAIALVPHETAEGEAWCPRCAASYVRTARACSECVGDVSLMRPDIRAD